MIRKVLQAVGSPRVTIPILLALGALFLAGLWIPQKAVLQRELYRAWEAENPSLVRWLEAARLTDIHRSPLAKALWGAFFANLLAALASRTPGILRRVRLADGPPDPAATGWLRRCLPVGAGGVTRARAFFEARGYAVVGAPERFRAVRNRASPLATILFHASFLVLLGGALASVATRFEGTTELAEGEEFTGSPAQYEVMPRISPSSRWPTARFTVEEILPELVDDVPVGVAIRLRDGGGGPQRIEINRPYDAEDGTSFVFQNLGVAPILVLTTLEGAELWSGGIRLRHMDGEEERFRVGSLQMAARLYPDWFEVAGEDRTRSREVKDLALRMTVDLPSGRVSRLLRPGESMHLGGYELHFADWRYWVRLYVRSERGVGVIFAGFAMATIALVWRLVLYRRDFVVAAAEGGATLDVAGRADYYRSLFSDEFEVLVRDLTVALATPPEPGVDR